MASSVAFKSWLVSVLICIPVNHGSHGGFEPGSGPSRGKLESYRYVRDIRDMAYYETTFGQFNSKAHTAANAGAMSALPDFTCLVICSP